MTLKNKLILAFLAVGIIPMVTVSVFSLWEASITVNQTITSQMHAMRDIQKIQIEEYFRQIAGQVRTMSSNSSVVDAANDFSLAADLITADDSISEDISGLEKRYTYQMENTKGATEADMNRWIAKSHLAKVLQSQYISKNKHPIGEKHKLDKGDDSYYGEVHAKYHPGMRAYLEEFGYYDIFIVHPKTGSIIYSVFKEVDYATSLKKGPYAQSGIGNVYRKALALNDPNAVVIEDFAPYEPSYNAPAAFAASQIANAKGKIIGILIFQMPLDRISKMVRSAAESSTYESIETFVLGDDMRLRTDSHLDAHDATFEKVDVETVQNAFVTDGLEIGKGRLGYEVLSSHDQLDVQDVKWALVTQVKESEVMAPVTGMRNIILAAMAAFVGLTIAISLLTAKAMMGPIQEMANLFNRVISNVGEQSNTIKVAVESMVAASEETSQQTAVVKENSNNASENAGSVAAAVEEMDASIAQINTSIGKTEECINTAVEKSDNTGKIVTTLEQASGKIADVLTLINDIADQTNLLALNAAIEAARAGDAGRGFSVVAEEVKKLAQSTINATQDINEQIASIQSISKDTVGAMGNIRTSIEDIRENASSVTLAVAEQSQATSEISNRINDTVREVQGVDSNMAGIEEATGDTSVAANEVMQSMDKMEEDFQTAKVNVAGMLKKIGI